GYICLHASEAHVDQIHSALGFLAHARLCRAWPIWRQRMARVQPTARFARLVDARLEAVKAIAYANRYHFEWFQQGRARLMRSLDTYAVASSFPCFDTPTN